MADGRRGAGDLGGARVSGTAAPERAGGKAIRVRQGMAAIRGQAIPEPRVQARGRTRPVVSITVDGAVRAASAGKPSISAAIVATRAVDICIRQSL